MQAKSTTTKPNRVPSLAPSRAGNKREEELQAPPPLHEMVEHAVAMRLPVGAGEEAERALPRARRSRPSSLPHWISARGRGAMASPCSRDDEGEGEETEVEVRARVPPEKTRLAKYLVGGLATQ
nr:unnamed protein product [Digitaria exilis]